MQTHVDLHKHLQQRQASGFVAVWRSTWVCLRECGVRSTGFWVCMKVGDHVLQEGFLCLYERGNYVTGKMVVMRMWKVVYYRRDFCV